MYNKAIPSQFKQLLSSKLGKSTSINRKLWIEEIVANNYLLSDLVEIMKLDNTTANRYLWLISEIGLAYPEFLHQQLSNLYIAFEPFDFKYKQAFASYWLYVGIPEDNETKAIDVLIQILRDANVTSTIKLRAAKVLGQMAKKYPELKNEFTLELTPKLEEGSSAFKISIQKIIDAMNASD